MPSALSVVSVADLEAEHQKLTYLVKNVIPASSVVTLFGASGAGKSFLALDLALHVCYSMPWLGMKTKGGDVVYIVAEGGLGILGRIKAWHIERKMDWRQCPLRLVVGSITLRNEGAELSRRIAAAGLMPVLVIADTMSQTYSGDENDAAEVASFFRVLVAQFVTRFRCTVVLVHHTGHSATERPRGSSAITANSDCVYGVFKSESGSLCTLECQKMKDSGLFPAVSFNLRPHKLGIDEDGDAISSLAAVHIADPAALATAVGAGPDGPKKALLSIAADGLPLKEARRRFYAESDLDDPASKRQQWKRSLDWAIGAGLVTQDGGLLRRVTS